MNLKETFKKVIITIVFLCVDYALSKLEIPLIDNRVIIRFTFITGMLYACYFNVWWCVAFGILGDVVPFIFDPPSYSFFVGYSISAALKMAIYRYFLYNGGIKFKNAVACRLCSNTIINMLLGSLWIFMLYNDSSSLYLGSTLLKNILLVPIEAAIFYVLYLWLNKLLLIIKNTKEINNESR